MVDGAYRYGLFVRPSREDWLVMAFDGRGRRADERHPEVRGDRHAPGGEPQRDRGRAGVSPRDRRRAEDRAVEDAAGSLGEATLGGERSREDADADRAEGERGD